MHGFLDRFEGELAVILVEDALTEFTVLRDDLPEDSQEGTIFHLDMKDNNYMITSIDSDETAARQENAALLLGKLKKKQKKSKFKR